MDTGLKLFDNSLNLRLQRGFSLFLEEYERAGRDPSRMDLAGLKEEFGGDVDLYVINESGVVEYTTYLPDRGLDLYICRKLVERYGGRIRADDRVAGRPEEGAAIRFTLKKAT